MSVRLRISVLRLFQLSFGIRRFYDGLDDGHERCGVRIRRQPPPGTLELASGPVELAGLRAVAGSREVVQAAQELVVAEPEALGERPGGGHELVPLQVPFGAPADRAQARFGRGPLFVRVAGHGHGRAYSQLRPDRA